MHLALLRRELARGASPLAISLAVALLPSTACAIERQLHGGPTLGGYGAFGASGGGGGTVGLSGGYGLSDSFRLYTNLEYGLGVDAAMMPGLRHSITLSAGVAYAIDVVSVLPWFGLGLQAGGVFTNNWVGFVPAAEARIGIDWLTSRYFGLTFQAAGTVSFANFTNVMATVSGLAGLRWTVDL